MKKYSLIFLLSFPVFAWAINLEKPVAHGPTVMRLKDGRTLNVPAGQSVFVDKHNNYYLAPNAIPYIKNRDGTIREAGAADVMSEMIRNAKKPSIFGPSIHEMAENADLMMALMDAQLARQNAEAPRNPKRSRQAAVPADDDYVPPNRKKTETPVAKPATKPSPSAPPSYTAPSTPAVAKAPKIIKAAPTPVYTKPMTPLDDNPVHIKEVPPSEEQ